MNPSDHFFEGYAAARGASILRPIDGRVTLRDALTIVPLDPPRQASLLIVPEELMMLSITALTIVADRGTVAHVESVRVGDRQQFKGPVRLCTHGMGALHVFEVEDIDFSVVNEEHVLRLLISFECGHDAPSAALTIGAQYWKQFDMQCQNTRWP